MLAISVFIYLAKKEQIINTSLNNKLSNIYTKIRDFLSNKK